MDLDLIFLRECGNSDLKDLADCIIHEKGEEREERINQRLSKKKKFKDSVAAGLLPDAVELIVDEYLRYGGSTFTNIFRGHGVSYREILKDICSNLGVYSPKGLPVITIERNLILRLMEFRLSKMDEKEVKELYDQWCKDSVLYSASSPDDYKDCIIGYAMSYQNFSKDTMRYIINELRKYLESDSKDNWILSCLKEIQRPHINKETLINAPKNIASMGLAHVDGPAFRVTFPCTLYIIYMRQKYYASQRKEMGTNNK